MSTNYYVIERKNCRGCCYKGLYALDRKNPYRCYHPSRNGKNPSFKKRNSPDEELKECKLLKRKIKWDLEV